MPVKTARAMTGVVTGDVTVDWALMRQRAGGSESAWNPTDVAQLHWLRGGAALLGDLVEHVAKRLGNEAGVVTRLHRCGGPGRQVRPDDSRFHHSHAIWSLFDRELARDGRGGDRVWRVESFLGLDVASTAEPGDWQSVQGDPPSVDLIVLDDAGLGFRNRAAHWPRALRGSHARWVLLKMAAPVAQGDLWALLRERHPERLVVVVPVSDLRLTEVHISRELSWERTAQDLAWELSHNPRINELSRCAHVIVSLGTAGAFMLSNDSGGAAGPRSRLFFDPTAMEAEWAQTRPGGMVGYTTCLTAAIARELITSTRKPDIETGVLRGLAAVRRLHVEGYLAHPRTPGDSRLAFPFDAIVDEIESPRGGFSICDVPDPTVRKAATAGDVSGLGRWTILQQRHPEGLDGLAERIVLEGPARVLKDVPLQRFGKLVTVDRQEIEAYRSIRALILEHSRRDERQPLSIAVFGPPGSGKSFGVREISESLPGVRAQVITFNLSQLRGRDDLLGAFHQIRDVVLSGRLPVVFWDEFDAMLEGNRLGWLPTFLTPMQDGVFEEGQITHPIGRSVFVFAGGTSRSMEEFSEKAAHPDLAHSKAADFISRVRGFVNVMGPDPIGSGPESDPYHRVRRAILLRAILEHRAPQVIHPGPDGPTVGIDSGVLRAFLQVRRFRHGARSIESIVSMSRLQGANLFERSALPPEAQLELHVDASEFLALVQMPELKGPLLERLAAAVHETFCRGLEQAGYRPGRVTNDTRRIHALLKPYARLPKHELRQNRDNARDLPRKLSAIGLVMTPARDGRQPPPLTDAELERLAEDEHDRWVRLKLAAGWKWGPRNDRGRKRHPDLVPWELLSDEGRTCRYSPEERAALGPGPLSEVAREKDRSLVRGIPAILSAIGYTVSRAQGLAPVDGRGEA